MTDRFAVNGIWVKPDAHRLLTNLGTSSGMTGGDQASLLVDVEGTAGINRFL